MTEKNYAVAKASNGQEFNYYKVKFAQEIAERVHDMMKIEPVHWARIFFSREKNCESVDNNMC
jgi:hypothetical protein